MDSFFHRLPYTHEEVEALLNKIATGEVLKADDYEKLINVIGLDNISTFSGHWNDIEGRPNIPSKVSDLINDLGFDTSDDVNRKITNAIENVIELINEYENDSEVEYAKKVALENQAETLKIYTDEEIYKAIRSLDLSRFIDKSALNLKADAKHSHNFDDITSLNGKLDSLEYQIEKIDKSHEKYDESCYQTNINKENIKKLESTMSVLDNKIGQFNGELIAKANTNHNHDSLYADVAFEHHHCNQEVLEQITSAMLRKWNDGLFITYHDGKDDKGNYLNTAPDRPIGEGNVEGWHTDATPNVVWMSHKIAPCIKEGIWSKPIKLVGRLLEGMTEEFYLSDSASEPVGGQWIDRVDSKDIGDKFLWNRFKVTWKNPDNITYTEPMLQQLNEFLKKIEENLGNVSDNLSENYYTKQEIDAKENVLNNTINTKEQTLNNTINSNVQTLNNTINTTKNNLIDKINTEVNTLNSTINSKIAEERQATEQDVTRLDGRVDTTNSNLTSNVNTLNGKIKTNADSITNINSDIVEINADIVNTNNKFNNYYNKVTIDEKLGLLKSTVEGNYVTTDTLKQYSTTTEMKSAITQSATNITTEVSATYQTKDAMKNYSTTTETQSKIDQKADSILSTVSKNYQTIDGMKNYNTKTETQSAIDQKADSITTSVSKLYQTKDEMKNYSTTTEMRSEIQQKADSITQTVSKTYQTKDGMSGYSTTTQIQSMINQKADSITQTITNKGYQTSSQVQQTINNWSASFSVDKVNTGIVTLNSNGVTVSHTAHSTKTQMTSSGFYCSSNNGTKQYGIENGVFYAYSDTGTKVCQIGRAKWADTNNFLTSVAATFNHTVGLGVQEEPGGDPIVYVMIAGKTEEVRPGKFLYQGANIATAISYQPHFFRTGITDTTALLTLSYVRALSNGNRTFALMGENQVALGTVCNNTYSFVMDGSTGKNVINSYCPINMNGYSLADASMTMALDAQSPTTYGLRNKAPEQFVHNSYCTTEGELRHTCRETMHTTEEYDYNESGEFVSTGRYVCYCELPLFMAENIELDYHVSVSKLSFGDYRIVERTPYYFVLESEKDNFAFTYEIVAKQIEKASAANSIVANNGMFAGDSEPAEEMDAPEEIH
jgi:hypothetical protein